jgi:hypothetical protein
MSSLLTILNKRNLPQMRVCTPIYGADTTWLVVQRHTEKQTKAIVLSSRLAELWHLLIILTAIQPGIPRTPAQTIRIIKRQIWAACSGVQDAVDELQTSTGVKDKTAVFWIAKLIVKARETQKERFGSDSRLKDKKLKGEARKAVKNRIKDLIQWELYNWVILQPEDRSSKLPRNSCVHIFQLKNYV